LTQKCRALGGRPGFSKRTAGGAKGRRPGSERVLLGAGQVLAGIVLASSFVAGAWAWPWLATCTGCATGALSCWAPSSFALLHPNRAERAKHHRHRHQHASVELLHDRLPSSVP